MAASSGSRVVGTVEHVVDSGKLARPAELRFRLTEIETRGGMTPVRTSAYDRVGKTHTKRNVGYIAGGAAVGAILGQVLGKDTEGTLTGAAAGAAVGTGVAAATGDLDFTVDAGADGGLHAGAAGAGAVIRESDRFESRPKGRLFAFPCHPERSLLTVIPSGSASPVIPSEARDLVLSTGSRLIENGIRDLIPSGSDRSSSATGRPSARLVRHLVVLEPQQVPELVHDGVADLADRFARASRRTAGSARGRSRSAPGRLVTAVASKYGDAAEDRRRAPRRRACRSRRSPRPPAPLRRRRRCSSRYCRKRSGTEASASSTSASNSRGEMRDGPSRSRAARRADRTFAVVRPRPPRARRP